VVRIGLCCGPGERIRALELGFDYVEHPAAAAEHSETTNLFFPTDVRIYGPDADGLGRGKAIIRAAAPRGVRLMVLGSGDVRTGGSEAEFYDLAANLDRFAQTLDMRVAPENLNSGETDVGTSLPVLARALAARGAPFTADTYHAQVEAGVPRAGLDFWREQVPFAPAHVHFASFDRRVPSEDDRSLRAFAARLRELGYEGRASLECTRDGVPDPGPIRRIFRR